MRVTTTNPAKKLVETTLTSEREDTEPSKKSETHEESASGDPHRAVALARALKSLGPWRDRGLVPIAASRSGGRIRTCDLRVARSGARSDPPHRSRSQLGLHGCSAVHDTRAPAPPSTPAPMDVPPRTRNPPPLHRRPHQGEGDGSMTTTDHIKTPTNEDTQ